MENYSELIKRLLNKTEDMLTEAEKHVLRHVMRKEPISSDHLKKRAEGLTYGQRVADKVASFGGSWPFIGLFGLFLACWITTNVLLLVSHHKPFDPYPFILLNLFLSMLAAIQAPVIMMSQNRQAAHDRMDAEHDYEVNLKAELEIMALHHKLDQLREQQWEELLRIQKEQIQRLEAIEKKLTAYSVQRTENRE
jgi:uncharacterized membrane protein